MSAVSFSVRTVTLRSRFAHFWRSPGLRKLRRNRLAVLGFVITCLFILMALFAPLLAKPTGNCLRDLGMTSQHQIYNPLQSPFWKGLFAAPQSCYTMQRLDFSQEPGKPNSVPGAFAPFGTVNGYNIYYGLIWGTRIALKMSFIIVGITLALGILIGAVSGYYGGRIDNLIQRFLDVLFAMPGLILTVVVLTILRTKYPGADPTWPIILAYCLAGWAPYARMIRGDVLKVRQLEYVDAAQSLGARDLRIIFKHVIPNSLTSVFTMAVLDLATVPLGIAALSFLGLGFEPGFSEWGQLVSLARGWLKPEFWYTLIYPASFIIVFSLAFNLFGDGLRDALDPRTR